MNGIYYDKNREATVDANGRRLAPALLDQIYSRGEPCTAKKRVSIFDSIKAKRKEMEVEEAAAQGEDTVDSAEPKNDGTVQAEGDGIKGGIEAQMDDLGTQKEPQKVNSSDKSKSRKRKDWSVAPLEGTRKSLRLKK